MIFSKIFSWLDLSELKFLSEKKNLFILRKLRLIDFCVVVIRQIQECFLYRTKFFFFFHFFGKIVFIADNTSLPPPSHLKTFQKVSFALFWVQVNTECLSFKFQLALCKSSCLHIWNYLFCTIFYVFAQVVCFNILID